ncbi:hypothetical protein AB0M41_41835 [Streptomyces sp. NPDC051896]
MALLTSVATAPLLTPHIGGLGQSQAAAAPAAHLDLLGAVSGPSAEHRVP